METILNEILSELRASRSNQKAILTTEEAAVYLGMRVSYLHKLTSNRKIPHRKPNGGKLYFLREELDKWVTDAVVPTKEQIINSKSNI